MPRGGVRSGRPRRAGGRAMRMVADYLYRGDRFTRPDLRGLRCRAVRRPDGKCIRSRLGTMLVETERGRRLVVVANQLRKADRG